MERTCTTPCVTRAGSSRYWRSMLTALVLLLALPVCALAGLSGTYTIGGSGADYSSISSAVSALDQNGVSGAVVFRINAGTYTSPSGGFWLRNVSGMSATNTVTFKPAANATVLIEGNDTYDAIFRIYGGHHFIIDGSNVVGGTSRDMTIRNTSSTTGYGSAVWMEYNADNNTIRNCVLQSNSAYYSNYNGGATVLIGRNAYTTSGGNDSNVVQNNKIGDDDGAYRAGVAVYLRSGTQSYPNNGNRILDNDIVNFGQMYGSSYYRGYSYGVYVDYYNYGTYIHGNDIHITEPIDYYYVYGIYDYEYYGRSRNTVIDGNRIYDLQTNHSYSYLYHIRVYAYRASNTTFYVTNNMISMEEEANAYCYGLYIYLYYAYSSAEANVAHNSVYAGGSNASRSTYMLYAYGYGSSATMNHYNNIYYSERTTSSTSYGMYVYRVSDWNSDNNLIDVRANSSWYTARYYNSSGSGGTYTTLAAYRSASGEDANSIQGDPQFIEPDNGNLHIDTVKPAALESAGMVLSDVTTDIDGNLRSTFAPDIGADEGNFNGGGISVISPNGGEEVTTDYLTTIRYSTNRPLGVTIDLSLDGGATWTNYGTVDPTNAGTNEFSFTTPDVTSDNALVRIVSTYNLHEADTSDRTFRLVRPEVSLLRPNGGEIWVPTDTNRISWTTQYLPPAMTVQLDYSTDAGSTWLPITTGLSSPNAPTQNSYDWIIPNTPSQQAMVRAKIEGLKISDASDEYLIIRPQPLVELISPSGGDVWYSGEKQTIEWNTVTTDYVRIGYSTDDGTTWTTLVDRVPAYTGSYDWTVPEGMNAEALVRVVNVERPRFSDMTDESVKILTSDVVVLSPNGGETFDLNQAISVNWLAANAKTLQLDYSPDNGQTWTLIAANIAANSGSFSFIPPQIPTKLARVRISDVEREDVSDVSDRPFEIMGSKSIVILAPGEGDQLLHGSSTTIMWDAPRIDNLNIYYSSTGGTNWITVASNVAAANGSYNWNVPNTLTTKGKIRLQEVGGNVIAESGTFSVVEEVTSSLRIAQPNGGEAYTEADPIKIIWVASADLLKVALSYSTDAGATWSLIAKDVQANLGSYDWAAPSEPSENYLVKVEAAGVSDVSDAPFAVTRQLFPELTLIAPNGGETFTEGDTVTVRWTSNDVSGTVKLSYSIDGGQTLMEIITAPVTPGSYSWMIPSDLVGKDVYLQIAATDGSAADISDDPFTVEAKPLEPIRVVSPNLGSETWVEATMQQITWESPSDITQVELHYSTDGGQSWMFIAGQSSSPGMNSYQWTIPQVVPMSSNSLIRVRSSVDTTRMDVSDNPFTLAPDAALSVPGAVAGINGMTVLGIYPNPFAASAELRWLQPVSGVVTVRIYDGTGRLVREIAAGRYEAGERHLKLGSDELASGIYYYEVRSGLASARGMMMIAR